jgi:glycosyltransferase involved in cell wall biosynthesis
VTMHPGAGQETVLVFDGAGYLSGHHGPFLHGVLAFLDEHDIPTVVCGPGSADPSVWGERPWRRAERASVRSLWKGRRLYRETMAWGLENKATKFIDLDLDRSLLRYSRRAVRRYSAGVAVLHGVTGFSSTTTGGVPTRLRRRIERRSLRSMGKNPDIAIMVHTAAAQRELAALGVQAHLVGVPIRSLPDQPGSPQTDEHFLLYVGDGRSEKGLPVLIDALKQSARPPRLRVAGSLDERKMSALASTGELEVENLGPVSDEELQALFATATATVLPYQPRFQKRAAASTLLLEAIQAGSPVVLPEWMVEQIPDGFQGFLSARDSSAEALSEAIDQLPADEKRLKAKSIEFGSEIGVDTHSFGFYTARLIALLGISIPLDAMPSS